MTATRLTPTMRAALLGASHDGVIREAARSTEGALIRRGLATAERGHVTIYRRSGLERRSFIGYTGARLTDAGRALAAQLAN